MQNYFTHFAMRHPVFTTNAIVKKIFGVGGFLKILCNYQSGLWQMLTLAYRVGGWGKKGQKYAYVIFEWSLSKT